MNRAEGVYFIIYGILLYLLISLVTGLIVDLVALFSAVLIQSVRVLTLASICGQIVFFIVAGTLSIIAIVWFTGKNPRALSKKPFGSMIVMVVLVPVLYAASLVGTPLLTVFYQQYFQLPGFSEYLITISGLRSIMGVLHCLLVSVLAIIALVRTNQGRGQSTSSAP